MFLHPSAVRSELGRTATLSSDDPPPDGGHLPEPTSPPGA